MTKLDDIKDLHQLREVARAERASRLALEAQVDVLRQALAKQQGLQQGVLDEVKRRLDELERLKAVPGHKSEARNKPPKKERKPQTGHGPTEQANLPSVEVQHTLDDADLPCPQCSKQLRAWDGQFETSEEIDVEVQAHVRRIHKRQKYHCTCGHIETALGPPRLVVSGRYSDAFIIQCAVQKYLDHIPLERQVRILARAGLKVTSQTLWDQLVALHRKVLEPAYKRLVEYQATKGVRHGDETRWPVFGKDTRNWTMWVDCSDDVALYMIADSRSTEAGRALFSNVNGVLMVDGYGVYEALAAAHPGLNLAFCWAHVRRKFLDIETDQPAVTQVLDLIDELFRIEKDGPPEQLLLRRQVRSQEVLQRIHHWMLETPALPKSPLDKAKRYVAKRWTGLTRFLHDIHIPLSNNLAERCLRGPVVGRKNHYGSHSRLGTEVAATAYSVMETAKLNGISGEDYLRAAVAAYHAGQPIPMPHELKNH